MRYTVDAYTVTAAGVRIATWPASTRSRRLMQYSTARFPLNEIAKVGPGDTVLVAARSRSAVLAAIPLARLLGTDVITQTRSSDKAAAIRGGPISRAAA
ncbi:MAG: NADPH:quinone reductase [Blastococcus sp.]|jgi:NADPH:quinone reductase-like Zn-dependent oxidoreductase|nr:NADPH:quinone reductase [Blastococcus sp.]